MSNTRQRKLTLSASGQTVHASELVVRSRDRQDAKKSSNLSVSRDDTATSSGDKSPTKITLSRGQGVKLKMHLSARAPNEGARRLAQWIANECGGDLRVAASKLYITEMGVQRVLDGEITPGTTLGSRMFKVFGARARMFNRSPAAGWFDAAPLAQAA